MGVFELKVTSLIPRIDKYVFLIEHGLLIACEVTY